MDDLKGDWEEFLRSRYWDEILELAELYPDRRSLLVKYSDIIQFKPELAEALEEEPDEVLEAARAALLEIDLPIDAYLDRAEIRPIGLPDKIKPRNLRSDHPGKLVAIEGMVKTASKVVTTLTSVAMKCQRCGYTFFLLPEDAIKGQVKCKNQACDRGGPFKRILKDSKKANKRIIKIQEYPEDLKGAEMPESIEVILTDDLVENIQPGNRLIVNGIVRMNEISQQKIKSLDYEHYIDAVSLEVIEREFEEIKLSAEDERKIKKLAKQPDIHLKIRASIAPSIWGHDAVKDAIALQLFSSPEGSRMDGVRVRGDIHVLLVGDPGIAKSQLLKYVTKVSPRGVYASGKGSSAAGLTAAAVKDELGDGRWTIEAGALPMADHGVAAIDELDKMDPENRDSLHEGLEQQTISVSKAGISATLKCRCSVLAAANPSKGRFDPSEVISSQIKISSVLLSRFDLIFVLRDIPSKEEDSRITDHILDADISPETVGVPEIEPEMLRKYIAYARKHISPILGDEARVAIRSYYLKIRLQYEGKADQPVPTTARQLQALIRLAKASARLRLSKEVELEDAERVIEITDACLRQVGIDPDTGSMDAGIFDFGKTKSEADKTKAIEKIIGDMGKLGEGAVLSEIYAAAEAQGIDRGRADKIIGRLKIDGDIFEPRPGIFRRAGI